MSKKSEKFPATFRTASTIPPDLLTEKERAYTDLAIADVQVNEDLFQPRNLNDADTKAASDAQVLKLLSHLENGEALDKISVWKWQGVWWCVDGFHRLCAYQQWQARGAGKAGRQRSKIPVKVVEGSLDDVIADADEENFKTKFNVSESRRLNRAWAWTKLGKAPEWIVKKAGVSRSTAYDMKRIYGEAQASGSNWDELPWEWAKKADRANHNEERNERALIVHQLKQGILKACAHRPKNHPDEFMDAVLSLYGEREHRFREYLNARERRRSMPDFSFEVDPFSQSGT